MLKDLAKNRSLKADISLCHLSAWNKILYTTLNTEKKLGFVVQMLLIEPESQCTTDTLTTAFQMMLLK